MKNLERETQELKEKLENILNCDLRFSSKDNKLIFSGKYKGEYLNLIIKKSGEEIRNMEFYFEDSTNNGKIIEEELVSKLTEIMPYKFYLASYKFKSPSGRKMFCSYWEKDKFKSRDFVRYMMKKISGMKADFRINYKFYDSKIFDIIKSFYTLKHKAPIRNLTQHKLVELLIENFSEEKSFKLITNNKFSLNKSGDIIMKYKNHYIRIIFNSENEELTLFTPCNASLTNLPTTKKNNILFDEQLMKFFDNIMGKPYMCTYRTDFLKSDGEKTSPSFYLEYKNTYAVSRLIDLADNVNKEIYKLNGELITNIKPNPNYPVGKSFHDDLEYIAEQYLNRTDPNPSEIKLNNEKNK